MNPLLFALVDAVLWSGYNSARQDRWSFHEDCPHWGLVYACTLDMRAWRRDIGEWRSLWGVL